jgi:predicted ATPase
MGSSAPPLVGRELELQALERALEEPGAGRARAVGIIGEPGIGKSRLLGELGRRARARGHLVMAGRASELERDIPFALWVQALDHHLERVGNEALRALGEERLADLAVALPAVRVRRRASTGAPRGSTG